MATDVAAAIRRMILDVVTDNLSLFGVFRVTITVVEGADYASSWPGT